MGKLQSRQPLSTGKIRHPRQCRTGLCHDCGRLLSGAGPVQSTGGINHQPIQSLIRNQQIRPISNDQRPRTTGKCIIQQQHQLLSPLRKSHAPGRPPDAEGGVPVHGLLLLDPQVRQIIRRLLVKCDPPVHFWTSSYFRLPGPAGPHR